MQGLNKKIGGKELNNNAIREFSPLVIIAIATFVVVATIAIWNLLITLCSVLFLEFLLLWYLENGIDTKINASLTINDSNSMIVLFVIMAILLQMLLQGILAIILLVAAIILATMEPLAIIAYRNH